MEGPATYVVLATELWTSEMHKMRCLVLLLEKALYGHKHAGVYWQKFCTEQCLKAGLVPFSDNWPCTYWNEEYKMFLIVYGDDMKLRGPARESSLRSPKAMALTRRQVFIHMPSLGASIPSTRRWWQTRPLSA